MLVLENQRWDQFSRKLNGIGSTTLHFWALGLRTSIVHWLQGHGHIFAFYRCECFCTVCVISTNVLLRFLAIPSGAFNENWESCWYTAALVYLFFFCFYLFCNSLIWVLMWGNFSWKRVGEGVFPWFVPFLFPCICIFLLFSYLRFFFFFWIVWLLHRKCHDSVTLDIFCSFHCKIDSLLILCFGIDMAWSL